MKLLDALTKNKQEKPINIIDRCPHCHNEITKNDLFCPACRTEIIINSNEVDKFVETILEYDKKIETEYSRMITRKRIASHLFGLSSVLLLRKSLSKTEKIKINYIRNYQINSHISIVINLMKVIRTNLDLLINDKKSSKYEFVNAWMMKAKEIVEVYNCDSIIAIYNECKEIADKIFKKRKKKIVIAIVGTIASVIIITLLVLMIIYREELWM